MKDSRSGSSTPALSPVSSPGSSPDSGSDELGIELLRRIEEEELEETRRRGREEWRERLRTTLYQPSEELVALSGRVIGAAMEVHTHLGAGYTEVVYHRALCRELSRRSIPFATEVLLDVLFKDDVVGQFRVDLIVDGNLIIELKAVEQVTNVHVAQMISYLRATGIRCGLIVNFNVAHLRHGLKRVTWSR
jgi:GxxExxY protein